MEVTDILPIDIAYNNDFITFKQKCDNVIIELDIDNGDKDFRNKLQPNLNKRLHSLMLCDLRRWIEFKKSHHYLNELKYNGRVYFLTKRWVSVLHPIILTKMGWQYGDDLFKQKFPRKPDETYAEYNKRKEIFTYSHNTPQTFKDVENLKWYKIKLVSKILNYKYVEPYEYDATGLKYYNPMTKKTSNKKLKAIKYYDCENYQGRKCGWEFGGITAYGIEKFCIQNGFIKDKKTKYQYGDYAEWILKTLN